MDDSVQCIEQIAHCTQRLALVEVQKKFLEGEVEAGSSLLSQWEQYLHLPTKESNLQTTETYSSTIELNCKRVEALQNVLNSLPRQKCVEDLQQKLRSLKERLMASNNKTRGGTFEWVDSLLVKCLREGSWLMIDNVNLCSPAVLDRLNGLLEPGGELVVGERGVGADGRLVTVTPHPDFRLFLIMDPRFGEISRAMRNRGVELCLLDHDSSPTQLMDLQAILRKIGMSRNCHQMALINIHEEMKSLAIGFEAVTTSHLFQAASLAVQQAIRGHPFLAALHSACSDVYVQSRQLTVDQRDRCSQLLSEVFKIQEHLIDSKVLAKRDALHTAVVTLGTLSLQENSALVQFQQKCAMLSTALRKISKSKTFGELFKDYLKDNHKTSFFPLNVKEFIPQIFLTFISSVSINDLRLRRKMMLSIIASCKSVKVREKLSDLEKYSSFKILEVFNKTHLLIEGRGVKRRDICWDLRRASQWMGKCPSFDLENKTIALLYYLKQSWAKVERKRPNTVGSMTALEFSRGMFDGRVAVANTVPPVVQHLHSIMTALDGDILDLIKSSTRLSTEQTCQLITANLWVSRLQKVAQRHLFVSDSILDLSEDLVTLLTLHIIWLKKHLIPHLSINSDPPKDAHLAQLKNVFSDVSLTRPVRSLSKKVRRALGQPLPLSNHLQGGVLETIKRLEGKLDIETCEEHQHLIKKVEFLVSKKGRTVVEKMISSYGAFTSNNDLPDVKSQLEAVESILSTEKVGATPPHDVNNKRMREDNKSIWEVALWPVKGVIWLRLVSAVLSSPSDQMVADLCSLMRQLPLVPPRVQALAHNMANNQLTATTALMAQLSQSQIVTKPRKWLMWGSLSEQEVQHRESETYQSDYTKPVEHGYPLHSPLLCLFTSALLRPTCDDTPYLTAITPALASHRQHSKLLASLQDILWKWGPTLASTKLSYRTNEERNVKETYEKFLQTVKSVVETKLSSKNVVATEKSVFLSFGDLVINTETVYSHTHRKEVIEVLIGMAKHIEIIENVLRKLKQEQYGGKDWFLIGLARTHLGLLQLRLFAHQDHLDPFQINLLKLQYCIEEREELEQSLAVEKVQGMILGSYRFPLDEAFTKKVEHLLTKENKLRKFVAKRPLPNVYTNLYNEIRQLLEVMVSPGGRVEALASFLSSCMAGDKSRDARSKDLKEAVTRAQSLLTSLRLSVKTLNDKYGIWYPDVIVPVVSAVTQMSHGLSLMIGGCNSVLENMKTSVEPQLRVLVRFPQPDLSAALETVNICTSVHLRNLLLTAVKLTVKENVTLYEETFRLAKCSLQELRSVVSVKGAPIIKGDWSAVCNILNHLVSAWQQQEKDKARRELEESNYFINKPRKVENLTEEEEDTLEMSKLFPSHRDNDFADLEPPSLEQKKVLPVAENTNSDPKCKLTEENIQEIHKVHAAIVTKNTSAHWIQPVEGETPDFTTPFSERFRMFSALLNTFYKGCNDVLDSEVIPALCLGVHLASTEGSEGCRNKRKHYDFYHDSNINEIKLCIPVLDSVMTRVLQLLEEWPDHPTLYLITVVIKRILSFSSQSPVSRFLVGLELLLTRLREWEENAHAGVTLGPHMAAVTRLVLDWRRLELTQWRGCLESARIRMCESVVSKWWFHLYSLVSESAEADQSADPVQSADSELGAVLQQFMETSTLGEYQTKLDLLYSFHCHCVNSGKRFHSNMFWNVYQYYSQFSRVIAQRIKELSLPIEKKLKDFVKIARWNDINYWSVRETVHKTHRTLFKYIRDYEGILKQPARSAMTRMDAIRKQTFVLNLNPALYIASSSLTETLSEEKAGEGLLSQQRSLFTRARKLCRDSVTNCPIQRHISALHMIVEEVQEVSELLGTEDVDRTVSKEKQKSAARNVMHRKRKALTDLFHTLAGLGLSYRAGLVVNEERDQFTHHSPLNVNAGLAQIDSKSADKELLSAWEGCGEYFLHAVAFTAQLRSALNKPHKDLGPAVVDRCKGFTNHLMSLCHLQKKNVTQSMTALYALRCLVQHLSSMYPDQTTSSDLKNLKNDLMSLLKDIIYCLSQFEIVVDTCPKLPDVVIVEENSENGYGIPESTEVSMSQGDEKWNLVKSKTLSALKQAKKSVDVLKDKGKFTAFLEHFQKTNDLKNSEYMLTFEEVQAVKDVLQNLMTVNNDIREILNAFRMKDECDVNPMTQTLNNLVNKIDKLLETSSLNLPPAEVADSDGRSNSLSKGTEINEVETFLNKVLFAIQEFYKKNSKNDADGVQNAKEQNDENDSDRELLDSHLKEKVVMELSKEVELLKVSEVTNELQNLVMKYNKSENIRSLTNCVKQCLPLLHQYSLLAQYLITQQIYALRTSSQICSSVLSVFVDLANKGFRVPEELLEEEGEGAEMAGGGLGLGEGQGEKDVSDQIESQDQLEDAKKPGEHDKEEDKDCKEEEKGIEMTDEFGGKLQDIEKKQDEDGNEEESDLEEEEPDKEMGETEKGAETLDQQVWGGSDSEEEEEREGDMKEEEGDRGEQEGEKEMGAKDEKKTPQGDDDDRHGDEDKKDKKKEINEMEEPEVDDDQIDPYHGKQPPQPEPEPMDLPDDLQLDDGDGNDKDEEEGEDNPFEIDAMKEPKLPEETDDAEGSKDPADEEKDKEKDAGIDSSDEDGEGGDADNDKPEEMDVDEAGEKQEEENHDPDGGGAKDENKTGEEERMEEEEEKTKEEEAKPSEDLPSLLPVPSSQHDSGSKDQVQQPESNDQSKELSPDDSAAEGPDQQGLGAAPDKQQQEAAQGSRGQSRQAVQSRAQELREERRERPGESEENRAMGDVQEPLKKKLKTINMQKENEVSENHKDEGIHEDQNAELHQHIKEASKNNFDAQTLDAATEEQSAQQNIANKEDEEAEDLKDDTNTAMDEEEEKMETENIISINPEVLKESNENNKDGAKQPSADGERVETEAKMDVEGELVETMTVERGSDSWFHTRLDNLSEELSGETADVESVRKELEAQLATWSQPPANEEAARAWERLCSLTADLSRELSEQLRLVLEPTHASRLRGDFRTGRRINMRKVIPYIASQFRKDKIWLRRTKPAKREYQIVLAIDDSSSMADNHSKELAFESLAVVSKALSLLEAGQLSVLSFGEKPKILHQLGDPFTEHSGARLLQQFSFEQQKTQVGELVSFACSLFSRNPPRRGMTDVAQLLVIVSDGRGVLNDGEEVVRQAVRRAKHMGVFMVFVIIDNPQSKDSILDIRLPKFSGGKLLGIVPYMDSFPFPFYLILRDINSLPSVLSDALRQWFELVTNTS